MTGKTKERPSAKTDARTQGHTKQTYPVRPALRAWRPWRAMAAARAVVGQGERAERRVGACTKQEDKRETEKGEKNGRAKQHGTLI